MHDVSLQVNGMGIAHIGWQRDRWVNAGGGAIFLTRISAEKIETDSIAQSGLHEFPSFAVSSEGYDEVLWPHWGTQGPWTLHYSSNWDAPLFTNVRTFRSVQYVGNFLLFLDQRENPRCVFSNYSADTTILLCVTSEDLPQAPSIDRIN